MIYIYPLSPPNCERYWIAKQSDFWLKNFNIEVNKKISAKKVFSCYSRMSSEKLCLGAEIFFNPKQVAALARYVVYFARAKSSSLCYRVDWSLTYLTEKRRKSTRGTWTSEYERCIYCLIVWLLLCLRIWMHRENRSYLQRCQETWCKYLTVIADASASDNKSFFLQTSFRVEFRSELRFLLKSYKNIKPLIQNTMSVSPRSGQSLRSNRSS